MVAGAAANGALPNPAFSPQDLAAYPTEGWVTEYSPEALRDVS